MLIAPCDKQVNFSLLPRYVGGEIGTMGVEEGGLTSPVTEVDLSLAMVVEVEEVVGLVLVVVPSILSI
jgi:hypothetical protein